MENILAIDIGGTFIKFGIVDDAGVIKEKGQVQTPDSLESLIHFIQQQIQEYEHHAMYGIAISSPGSVANNGVIYGASSVPYIHGPNMKELVEEATGLTVHIENDANCAALAEVWKGSAVDKADIAVVVIGTGIGGALVKDGKIDKGSNLHGGEFGYMILDPHNFGSGMNTFSEVASSYSIIKRVAKAKGVAPATLTGEEIFVLAESGDDICKHAINEFYRMLAIGLYNIQYAYDPELILIGGGISARPDLIARLQKELTILVDDVDVATITPNIDSCNFSADANLIGSVYHYIQQKEGK